jgi:hypothetical protein
VSQLSEAEFLEIAINFKSLKEKMQAIEYSISPELVYECFNTTYVVVNFTDDKGDLVSQRQRLIDFQNYGNPTLEKVLEFYIQKLGLEERTIFNEKEPEPDLRPPP